MTTFTDRIAGLNAYVATKPPARAATTANITLSGAQTIDGVAVTAGDRVLVKDQTDATENGIWEVATGAWSRTPDFNGARDVVSGTQVFVTSGTTNGRKNFSVTTPNDITIGTTELTFAAGFNGAALMLTDRDASNAAFLAGLAEGTVGVLAGLPYRVDSTATGTASATNDLLVDGLVPFGPVRPQHFGATPGGLTDATDAVKAALAWVLANGRLSSGGETTELKHGYPALVLDDWFAVDESLTVSGKFGVTLTGVGPLASGLIFTATSGTLFDLTGWGNVEFRDMGLVAGTVTEGADGKADVALETGGSRTNVCFDLDGDGGGTQFIRRNCLMEGWSVVDQSINSTVNGDNVRAYDCLFSQNDLIAENTNSQAVIWRYVNCKFRHNQNTFKNLGNNFRIVGCDVIDKGKFLEFTGLSSIGEGGIVEGCKFEDYQNIDATTQPQWLVTSGTANVDVLFRDCVSTDGSAYSKTGMSLDGGNTRVTFDHCEMTGELAITSGASVGGLTPTLIFDNSVVPTITQTVEVGQGNTPINLIVLNSRLAADDNVHQVVNRQFWGSVASSTDEFSVDMPPVAVGLSATVNAGSSGKAVPIWCPAPYKLAIMGMRVIAEHSTANAFDITLWADSTKAVKLLEITGVGTGTADVPFFEEVRQSGLTTEAIRTSTSDPAYLEFTAVGDAGTVVARVEIDLMQATL